MSSNSLCLIGGMVAFVITQQVDRAPQSAPALQIAISPTEPQPVDSAQQVRRYALKNAAAADMADALNRAMQKFVDGNVSIKGAVVNAPLLIIPNMRANALTVIATEAIQKQVADLIRTEDADPTQIEIKCELTEIVNGRRNILTRPTIRTINGQTVTVSVGNAERTLEIVVTPVVKPPKNDGKVDEVPPHEPR